MSFFIELPPHILEKAEKLGVFQHDITEQFITGSGKGGQKINKTSSCVMLKHIPTGIIVRCQKHREQSKNRISAYKLLILKIEERIEGKKSDLAQKIYKIKKQKQKRSKRAKEKILHDKAHRGEIKEQRRPVNL
ncbi:MAG: peptide chain release factor-like protein [Patescibacteria group bacterium]